MSKFTKFFKDVYQVDRLMYQVKVVAYARRDHSTIRNHMLFNLTLRTLSFATIGYVISGIPLAILTGGIVAMAEILHWTQLLKDLIDVREQMQKQRRMEAAPWN